MTLALYRKYRPQSFSDVRGQEQVVTVLERSLAQGNVSHAYLFAGTRGTGKTSVARIVAKTLGVSDTDLYELDAASNRGIDDIRALRDAVQTLPFESKYKLYIIDEVHMLTKEAFNALLKTLEEPPAHVIFILATTEIDRLPETIVSRCEVHTFKPPSRATLREHIIDVAKREGFSIDTPAADMIALLADGSFRDATGVLQKVIASSSGATVGTDEVALILSAPKRELVNDVLRAIEERDAAVGIAALERASNEGVDMRVFGKLLLEKMRAILLSRYASGIRDTILAEFPPEDVEMLVAFASSKEQRINSAILLRFIDAFAAIPRAHIGQLPLQLALIDAIGDTAE